MHSVVWIFAIPVVIFSLMELYPRFFIRLIAAMRCRFRCYLINRYGKKSAKLFVRDLRIKYAKQGYDMEAFEVVIADCMPQITSHFGEAYANDFLGEGHKIA